MAILPSSSWLENVLISGGEKFVATALWGGWKVSQIYDRMLRSFGLPAPRVFDFLLDFARSAISAGELLQTNQGNFALPQGTMPINPYLFGDTPGGRREFWRTRVTLPDVGKAVFVDVSTPDLATWNDLISEGEAGAIQVFTMYPGKFGFETLVLPPSPVFEIVFGEARF